MPIESFLIYLAVYLAVLAIIVILFIHFTPKLSPEKIENKKKLKQFYNNHPDWKVRFIYNYGLFVFTILFFGLNFWFRVSFIGIFAVQQLSYFQLVKMTERDKKDFKDFDKYSYLMSGVILLTMLLLLS